MWDVPEAFRERPDLVLFKTPLFICLRGREKDRDTERKFFQLLILSPAACNGKDLARLRLEAGNSIRVSHVDSRDARP